MYVIGKQKKNNYMMQGKQLKVGEFQKILQINWILIDFQKQMNFSENYNSIIKYLAQRLKRKYSKVNNDKKSMDL